MVMFSDLDALTVAVGEVLDPHLPIGIKELGMLESVSPRSDGTIEVVLAMPCQHCPGLQQLSDDIQAGARRSGFSGTVRVSFLSQFAWRPVNISPRAQIAMRSFGIQVVTEASEALL